MQKATTEGEEDVEWEEAVYRPMNSSLDVGMTQNPKIMGHHAPATSDMSSCDDDDDGGVGTELSLILSPIPTKGKTECGDLI